MILATVYSLVDWFLWFQRLWCGGAPGQLAGQVRAGVLDSEPLRDLGGVRA